MRLKERIGIDIGRRAKLEDGIAWAAKHGVRYIDIQLDTAANALTTFDDRRAGAVRAACEEHGISLGLHTLSAVNVAEYSPFVADAVERYLEAYIDIFPRLGAKWIVVHAGYHFSSDKKMRMDAGLERLKRITAYAEKKGALILLENLNKEPEDAEVHYLAHTTEEWRYYYERIASPAFKLSFTANHAHLVPEGIEGFVAALDMDMVYEVRLADCFRNGHEVHLKPGAGDLDFGDMFRRVEGKGFRGHYTNAFTTLDDMLWARDYLAEKARAAGVAT
ncbi:MAG TPA: sugar phosphate isomerase/epimerase family protein [Usitatibacter sp.]|nr:sugar phosphate isomerase/epimerase family protein [Usitatibacter sp.]